MLRPDDIRDQCLRKYPDYLRSLAAKTPFFPFEIRFGRPSPTDDFEKLKAEINALAGSNMGYAIEWTEAATRRWGRQTLPSRVWFEEAPFLRLLGKEREVEIFRQNLELAQTLCPALQKWLETNAPKIAEHARSWPDLLRVCLYFLEHPKPNLYARQLPLPVHSKFVEEHRDILRSLLDFLIPEHLNPDGATFEERFWLRADEPHIRLRFLDGNLRTAAAFPVVDATLPLSSFQALGIPAARCLVVENKMVFLTLPALDSTLAILGGGKAAALLNSAAWLEKCDLAYWGDLDDAGFAILSRLRRRFPRVSSLMMDWPTWSRFSGMAVPGHRDKQAAEFVLTDTERRVWELVRERQLLLEQERLPQSYVEARLREWSVLPESPQKEGI